MDSILTPVLALVCWSLVMWLWMYFTRIPAMRRAGLNPAVMKAKSEMDVLPLEVRRVADNYNHLHEQPTIFYALVFYTQLAGNASDAAVMLAWAYVGLRVLHSLVQTTINRVMLRFGIFVLATLSLFGLAGLNLMAV